MVQSFVLLSPIHATNLSFMSPLALLTEPWLCGCLGFPCTITRLGHISFSSVITSAVNSLLLSLCKIEGAPKRRKISNNWCATAAARLQVSQVCRTVCHESCGHHLVAQLLQSSSFWPFLYSPFLLKIFAGAYLSVFFLLGSCCIDSPFVIWLRQVIRPCFCTVVFFGDVIYSMCSSLVRQYEGGFFRLRSDLARCGGQPRAVNGMRVPAAVF